jgi:hypothetical protein
MTGSAADIAAVYFDAWQAGDFARLRAILADDVTFDGPLGHAGNAEECIAGLQRMSQVVTDIVIRKTFIDGPTFLPGLTCTPPRPARCPRSTGGTWRTARSPLSG